MICIHVGGIFDPLNFSKGNLPELKEKEIKNGESSCALVTSISNSR